MPRKTSHTVSLLYPGKHSFFAYSMPLGTTRHSAVSFPVIINSGNHPVPACIKGFNNIWLPAKENGSLEKFNIAQTISNHKVGIKFVAFSVRKPAVGVYYLHRRELDLYGIPALKREERKM